ncbi:MAG: HD domain-containing phosphohydrolase, partial [Thermodesulfobacteriota bacterium]
LSLFLPLETAAAVFVLALLVIFPGELTALFFENRELHSRLADLKDTTDELFEQSEINYNNSLMTYEIGAAITKQTSSDNVLNKLVEILNFRLNFDRGMILLAGGNGDGPRLKYVEGFGYSEEQYAMLQKATFRLDNPDSKGVFVVSYRKQKPFLINDVHKIKDDLSSRSLKVAQMLGTRSFICCPILYERRSLGVLAVDNIQSKKPLAERDKNLLMGFAHMIGISLNNAELIETKENQFKSLLQTLAASIDARDPLTAGHSQQVTEYAVGICLELGLPEDRCEVVQVAALLHDYGKIGVPDAILKKPGKLNDQEYDVIKTHVVHTRKILNKIIFEDGFDRVPEIASSHHERLDGKGYPHGLHSGDISLESSIISVADVFEAITAKRHYRDPMPLDKAFGLLFAKKGAEFVPEVVDAFTRYYEKTYGYRYTGPSN